MKNEILEERLETSVYNESTIEHLHRYAIASSMVRDKIVLDIACGEGYGANLLAVHAKSVTGIDRDVITIARAKSKYIRYNLQFEEGLVENIPAPSGGFDVVVSFETLEHTIDQEKMLQEIKRVLKPGGLLIISTPNKKYYSDAETFDNPFHLKELYEDEFKEIISRFFKHSFFIYQKLMLASIATLAEESKIIQYKGNFEEINMQKNIEPIYLIALASDSEIEKPASSIFAGSSILQTALNKKEKELKKTLSYQIGHSLLYPFKLARYIWNR